MIVLISVTFYTKPDKTTKEPESPKCCRKLFYGGFLVFVKRQLTFWLTFSSLSIGVKRAAFFVDILHNKIRTQAYFKYYVPCYMFISQNDVHI